MEDSGGGGGSPSGTYWYGIDVQVMWDWVNRDLSPHYEQASSWKKASELAGLYAQRLQAFRDRLAQTWNPETSKASEAFLTRLDELIGSVKNIDTVAGANYQAAVDIPNAISEAKYKLQPIYNAWKASETPETATIQANQAAGVMYTLSSDLSGSRASIGPPQPYVAPGKAGGRGGDGDDYSSSSTATPPMIPPVVPMPPPTPPPTLPPPSTPMPFPQPKGPELEGLIPRPPTPTPPPTMPPPTLPPTTPPGPVPPGPVIKPPLPTNPGPVPPGGRPPAPIPTGRPPGPGMPPVMPPGGAPPRATNGLIGGAPPPPTTAGRTAGGPARPNPVGGMIGGATGGGRPGAPGGMGVAGGAMAGRGTGAGGAAGAAGRGAMGAMGAGGRPGQVHDEEGEHFDPDTQWDVAQGVAPVLDAPEERQDYIDPGPAIGLAR